MAIRRKRRFTYLEWASCLTLITIVMVAVVGYLARRVAPEPATGTSFNGAATVTAPSPAEPLRLVSFNIHSGKNAADEGTILDTFAALKPRGHFVALQEVRATDASADLNQAAILGDLLKLQWLYAPTEIRWGREHIGNGVLAAMEVKRWERVPLERVHGRALRNYVVVEFEWGGKTVRCLTTHVDSRADRDAQLDVVIEKFLALEPPSVLMGDLNATRKVEAMAKLLAMEGVVDAVGRMAKKDFPGRVDWIITRGFELVDGEVESNKASDHPVVWAEVRLKE